MKALAKQLRWQFVLLQKNNIISISIVVTLIYGLLLFFLRSTANIDKVLVSLILNDPTVIGYFFIALAIFTEMKHKILPAIFVTPISTHHYILSKSLSLSIIGLICSLGLAISIKGFSFDIAAFSIGAFGISWLAALLGIVVLSYSDDFLKFALLSFPVFLPVVNLPLLHYLNGIDLGFVVQLLPVQGGLHLIAESLNESAPFSWFSVVSLAIWTPLFYLAAYQRFRSTIIPQTP
ncbi:fluoroquinolone export ABC transporter permease subunit [Rhodohalobacter sp. 614A]|uniref:fluoroquinolone export ABC transporter permease subunit n=1 Tax=Rhodohalobacter sp. 614A TaxID=2908649 RepID=UPI001F3423ED|nr:hypothetical protein [Rhodohalobacter sp. 614A]